MAKALSEDLRVRVIGAVEGGLSRHEAAERFGIGAATAVRWLCAWRATGATAAKPSGGDRHSARIEAFGAVILAAVDRQVDITLVELAELLEREHGERFAPSTIWRFLDRRDLTFKKQPRTPASRRGPTSPPGAKPSSPSGPSLIPNAWSSSTRPAPRPRWRACSTCRPTRQTSIRSRTPSRNSRPCCAARSAASSGERAPTVWLPAPPDPAGAGGTPAEP
jgi:transposase